MYSARSLQDIACLELTVIKEKIVKEYEIFVPVEVPCAGSQSNDEFF